MGLFDKIDLPEVRHKIVIASGKGGVGKSMVSANLAMALARRGCRVALVDADIYGPSVPKMFDLEDHKLEVVSIDGNSYMLPVEKYGVKVISVGFMVSAEKGLVWRGPMASGALKQLFENTQWGEIDYMIIDFPPGTGDIQLTTMQKLTLSGAIIVTTPQAIALSDARRAASMFSTKGLSIPILGIIENMSWFTPRLHPTEKYYLFGKDGGAKLAAEINSKLLAQIPLTMEVGEAADAGKSLFDTNADDISGIFNNLAHQIQDTLK